MNASSGSVAAFSPLSAGIDPSSEMMAEGIPLILYESSEGVLLYFTD